MDSCLAAWMNPQVLTMTTLACSPSSASSQPPAASRAASSSESTSLRAQPIVTRLTVRRAAGEPEVLDAAGVDAPDGAGEREDTPARLPARDSRRGGPDGSAFAVADRGPVGLTGGAGGRGRRGTHLRGRPETERHRLAGAGRLLPAVH